MSRDRLPLIGSSSCKPTAHQGKRGKGNQQQTPSASCSHPGRRSVLLADTTMTPWGGLSLSETSFTLIPSPHQRPPPPTPVRLPPAPQLTPANSYQQQQNEEELSSSNMSSEISSPPPTLSPGAEVCRDPGLHGRQRALPQHRGPRPPRLPPLRQVTNLSFSRSFTFSFFELPLHQSPRCRAERTKNVMLLLRQIHY